MTKKVVKPVIKKQETKSKPLVPEKYQDAVFILLLVLSVFIFFWKAISGGGFDASDNIASLSFTNYLKEANNSGDFPLWMPYIFGGMPNYAALLTTGDRLWDIVPEVVFGFSKFIGAIFNNDVARIAFFYSIYGIGMYILMRSKKHKRFVAFFTGFVAIFSTWVITWVMIGHNTKPVVFSMFPFIFFFLEKLRIKFSIIYLVLLVFAIHIMTEAGHLQLIFYGACAFGLYLIFEFVSRIITKQEPLKILRVAGLLVVAGAIAFLLSSDRYLATLEYTPYSTRGSAPISKVANPHQDATGGNDYEYATMWSYNPPELFTFLVPSYFGFGVQEFNKQMQPTYWGSKESEDSPPYMGAIVFFLAIIGLIAYRKDVFVQFLIALSIFSVFLSFGKHLPVLYDLFYYIVPSFNKFRAPSMALVLIHFAFPILAGYGLSYISKLREDYKKPDKLLLKISLIIGFSFLTIAVIFSAIFKTSYLTAVATRFQIQIDRLPAEFTSFIWSSMLSDWFISAIIILITIGLVYFYQQKKIKLYLLFTIVAIMTILDLWRVDYRRMEVAEKSLQDDLFRSYGALYQQIKEDKSIYRIADFIANPANIPAYFMLQNINGYHSAKLRVYQDLMDEANSDNLKGSTSYLQNPFLWNLMNVKYIIFPDQSNERKPNIIPNEQMLPRVFFVNTAVKKSNMEILKHLKNGDFNPKEIAFIEQDLPIKIDTVTEQSTADISEYKNEYIKIQANASGNNLLFISEIYYPPCWFAYVDGKETPIYKTNYAFRSIIVPSGKHTIELKYISEKFELGKTLSIILNVLCFAALGFGAFIEYNKRKKKVSNKE